MAKFCNLLVYKYGKIDDARVYAILAQDLGDFEVYLAALARYLKEDLSDGSSAFN